MTLKFSIAALATGSPELGMGMWNDPNNETKDAVWLVPIPTLPAGEYKVVPFHDSMGEPCILVQRIGPPAAYAKHNRRLADHRRECGQTTPSLQGIVS